MEDKHIVLINKLKRLLANATRNPQEQVSSLEPPPSGMDKEAILRKIKEVPFWWHYIELGYGIVTPGHQGGVNNPLATKSVLRSLRLPQDLFSGKSILDIGAWDGFFSFEAEKRGVSRVLAIDNFYRLEKEGKHLEAGSRGFEIAKEILASKVEYKIMDVLEVSQATVGIFDIVLFLGVFYHMKHPLLALEKIASVTKEMMILESHFEERYKNKSVAIFYERNEINRDPTNWWGVNQACLEAMVRSVGFKRVECLWKTGSRIVLHAFKQY